MTVALVRRTSSRLDEGLLTHIERQPVDIQRARKQWESYVALLRDIGWVIREVSPLDACADSVFIEDTVVVYRDVAVITRPGSDARKPEVLEVEPVVLGIGLNIHHIVAPGTLDGGDVLKVGDTIYVGRGGRTNQQGIDQFTAIVEPLGAQVIAVPTTKALHLKSAITALPDGTIIGWEPVVDDVSIFPSFLAMPEEQGAHVVIVDDKRLIMSANAPRSAEILRQRGYEPLLVDIGEFEKLEGCVTCLSVRVRGN
jgi:dimethylargininase